jgi:hypothetical protein
LNYKFISSINKQKKKAHFGFGFFCGSSDCGFLQKNKKDRNFRQIRNDPDEN